MYNNKIKRRRHRSNGRSFHRRGGSDGQRNGSSSLFHNGHTRVSPLRGGQNIYKLVEKYKDLAKEALSSGDKILSENYFQHADHFSRIISDSNIKNSNNNSLNPSSSSNTKQDELADVKKNDTELEKNQT